MATKERIALRDNIKEILEQNCPDNIITDVNPLHPLLYWVESELHEYSKHLQGKVLDAQIERDALRIENEELKEKITECENKYVEYLEDFEAYKKNN